MRVRLLSVLTLAVAIAASGPAWAASTLEDIGPGGTFSEPSAISADGTTVVENTTTDAYVWTQGTGAVNFSTLSGLSDVTLGGVSANGSIISGSDSNAQAFIWSQATGVTYIGSFAGATETFAGPISADGSVVAGTSYDSSFIPHSYRWTQSSGMVDLGVLPGGFFSSVTGMDLAGDVIVGQSSAATGLFAYRWTQSGGMISLGTLSGDLSSSAYGVSGDGSTVVGSSQGSSLPGGQQAFRWTQGGGMVGLGAVAGDNHSIAYAADNDGAVIVGTSGNSSTNHAFYWTQAQGMRSLASILSGDGVDLTNWQLLSATGVSADGRNVVGQAEIGATTTTYLANVVTGGVTTPTALASSLSFDASSIQQSLASLSTGLTDTMQASLPDFALPTQTGRPAGDPESPLSMYVIGSAGNGQDGKGDNFGLDGTVGIMADVTSHLSLGGGIIGDHGHTHTDLGGTTDINATGGSAIISYAADSGPRLQGSAYIAHLDVDNDRAYQNGAGIDESHGNTNGTAYGTAVRGGWSVPVAETSAVMPYAEFDWSKANLDGYTEAGGAFPAAIGDGDQHRTVTRLGVEAAHRLDKDFQVTVHAAWGHALNGEGGAVTASSSGLTVSSGTTTGDRNWAEGGIGAAWRFTDAMQLTVGLQGHTGKTPEPAELATVGLTVHY